MEAPSGTGFSLGELRAIRLYIARRTGLYGDDLDDAVADGLLALVERGGADNIRAAKWFAFVGAVDAYRRSEKGSRTPARRLIGRPEGIGLEAMQRYIADDIYPSDSEIPRIVAWANKRPERTRRIVMLVLQGHTFEQAGAAEGVSPTRTSQLLHGKSKGNVPPPS